MNVDSAIFQFLYGFSNRSPAADNIVVFLAVYLPIILVVLAGFYILLSEREHREKAVAFISALFAFTLSRIFIGESLRALFPRERPMLALQLQSLFPEASYSFPSGHALTLFAVGGILFAYNRKLGVWYFAIASLACIARIAAGVHYPSDILGGALIGLASAWFTLRYITPHLRVKLGILPR